MGKCIQMYVQILLSKMLIVLGRCTVLPCCVLQLLHISWRNYICDTEVWRSGKERALPTACVDAGDPQPPGNDACVNMHGTEKSNVTIFTTLPPAWTRGRRVCWQQCTITQRRFCMCMLMDVHWGAGAIVAIKDLHNFINFPNRFREALLFASCFMKSAGCTAVFMHKAGAHTSVTLISGPILRTVRDRVGDGSVTSGPNPTSLLLLSHYGHGKGWRTGA